MTLAEECYRLSQTLPADERYGLTQQLRRASTSIPSNVAEGHSRLTTLAYLHHVSIALGSQAEVQTLIELCGRLGYISDVAVEGLTAKTDVVGRQLTALARALTLRHRSKSRRLRSRES